MFGLPLPLRLLILLLQLDAGRATTITNTTIDDQNSTILYSAGEWNLSSSYNSLDYDGFHHLSGQSSAFAVFNFTGVAIYFLSPLWPYAVGARLVLDDQIPPVFVDLQDHSRPVSSTGGPETVASAVVWGVENLESGNHSLRVEFAQGQSEYVILDAIIYSCIQDVTEIPASLSASSVDGPITMPSPSPTASQQTSSLTPASHSSVPSAGTGALVGVSVAVALFILAFLFLRYRRRKAVRLSHLNTLEDGEHTEEYHDRRDSILESSVTHDATILSISRSAERLLQAPAEPPTNLSSASRSALAISATASRRALPPINTKELPALPPSDEESQSALKYTKSIFSAVSKRLTTAPPLRSVPGSGSTAESATSSFFPKPIHDEDRGMLSMSRHQSLDTSTPGRMSSDKSNPMKVSRIGTYPGVINTKNEIQVARSFPVKSIRPVASATGDNVQPHVTVDTTRKRPQHAPPLTTKPSAILSPQTPSSPGSYTLKGKILSPLTIIPENSGGLKSKSSNNQSEENSPSPNKTAKRLSGGKLRVEKEKQRRRRPKTPVTPQGPRPRPLPSPPTSLSLSAYNTPLPSASSGGSPNSEAFSSDQSGPTINSLSTSSTTLQVRRRRPLPQTLPEARRSSLLLGSHILVPLKRVYHEPESTSREVVAESRVLEIDAIIQSQGHRLMFDKQERPGPALPSSSPDTSTGSGGLHTTPFVVPVSGKDDNDSEQEPSGRDIGDSPRIEWALPVLSHSMSLLYALPASTSHQVAPRPRSGLPVHSPILSSSLPSHQLDSQEPTEDDNYSPTPKATSTPGHSPLMPAAPNSANSATQSDPGNRSLRSPRRLPSRPQQLQVKNSETESHKETLDVTDAQYLTVPVDLNPAPPPYSGRHLESSKMAQAKMPTQLLAQEGVALSETIPEETEQKIHTGLGSTRIFTRREPQSIPMTPSEWRTSSTAQSLTTVGSIGRAPRLSERQDETAAEMLFELLDDAARSSGTFTSETSAVVRPISISAKLNRTSSMSPPRRQPAITNSMGQIHPTQQRPRESATTIPRVTTKPEDESAHQITQSGLSSARGSPLIVPPQPINPPPLSPPTGLAPSMSVPSNPRVIRSKIWKARGMNDRSTAVNNELHSSVGTFPDTETSNGLNVSPSGYDSVSNPQEHLPELSRVIYTHDLTSTQDA
ncbi:hypothetical protein DFH05DRAFT_214655 [Lentinula detonsa]|uniref:Uncharacterized protein n=1 Tax=Lentinula detonsa TaxID=2804962 RepID=A0A9W8TVY0_9AGAR|nr:hypothetical protein DFH05DRAFT_214655 [Lentinula detonsa]